MQGNKVQILHCKCGSLYMLNPCSSNHTVRCPTCGRTPRTEHLNQAIHSNFKPRLSSIFYGYVVPSALTLVSVIGVVVVLPRMLSQQVQPPTVSAPSTPTPEPSPSRSPVSLPNGTHLTPPPDLQGHGRLIVNNGAPRDAAVKLVDSTSGETIRFVYVQAKHDVTLKNLPPCNCIFKFTSGTDWDEQARKFLQNPYFSQFTDPLTFKEIKTEEGVKWQGYKVTLHSVPAGNAQTTPISESDFKDK